MSMWMQCSGESRGCKMRLSTEDVSEGFRGVLHDGWKGGRDEILHGELYLDGCSFMLFSRQTTSLQSRPAAGALQYSGALGSWKADRRTLQSRQ